jgi:hypothetical protein
MEKRRDDEAVGHRGLGLEDTPHPNIFRYFDFAIPYSQIPKLNINSTGLRHYLLSLSFFSTTHKKPSIRTPYTSRKITVASMLIEDISYLSLNVLSIKFHSLSVAHANTRAFSSYVVMIIR